MDLVGISDFQFFVYLIKGVFENQEHDFLGIIYVY